LAEATIRSEGEAFGCGKFQAATHTVGHILRRFYIVTLHIDDAYGDIAA